MHAGHFRLLHIGGLVLIDSKSMSDGARGDDENVMGKKDCLFWWWVITQLEHGCC